MVMVMVETMAVVARAVEEVVGEGVEATAGVVKVEEMMEERKEEEAR